MPTVFQMALKLSQLVPKDLIGETAPTSVLRNGVRVLSSQLVPKDLIGETRGAEVLIMFESQCVSIGPEGPHW